MKLDRLYTRSALALTLCGMAVVLPAQAHAQSAVDRAIATEGIGNQFIVTGLVGGTSGEELDDGGVDVSGAFAYLWNGVVGAEFLAGISPNVALDTLGPLDDSSLASYMVNGIVALPLSGAGRFDERVWQPYFSGGFGALNLNLDVEDSLFDVDETQLGANVGGGLMGFWNQWGVRGDLRWFNGLDDDDGDVDPADILNPASPLADFSFWRGNVGISYRW